MPAGKIAHNRYDEVVLFKRLEESEVVFSAQIVRLTPGKISLEKQLAVRRIVGSSRTIPACKLEIQPRFDERFANVFQCLQFFC